MVPGTQRIEQLIQGETITRRRPVQNQVSTAEGEFSWKGGSEGVPCNYNCGRRAKRGMGERRE